MDLRGHKAEDVARDIRNSIGVEAIGLEIDASDKNAFADGLDQTLAAFGRADILINGAGINAPTPFLDITIDEFNDVMKSQITSTLLGCQVFGRHMLDHGKGAIINISSASAGPPLSKAFSYSIAKAGILNLTQNLGREWGTKGVRVNAIRPGFFPTEWNRKNFITKDREAAILGHTPMARYGEVNELVGAVIYLASDAASFVTGSELTVDGGFSCMTI
jgi:NAD(P)-dependent dehydrogenase (short-subunit alcohol dehydrogenase family)